MRLLRLTIQSSLTNMRTTLLLDLPAEIRSVIWEHCRPDVIDVMACENHGQQVMSSGWNMAALNTLKTSPLLLVNKSIHHETRLILKPSINLAFACHLCMTRFFKGATDKQLGFISTISISECRVLPPGAPSITYSDKFVLKQKHWTEKRDRLSELFHGRVRTVEDGDIISCVSEKNWVRRWKVQVNHRKDIPERSREQALHLYLYLLLLVPYFEMRCTE